MSLDRRSFRLGILAGVFLFLGLVAGIVLSARLDWFAAAESQEASPPRAALPAGAPPNFVAVVRAVTPAVVNISTSRTVRTQGGDMSPFMDDPFFRQFFGDEFFRRFQIPRERRENSLGSGVIVSPDGYIVTNNHVIAKADEIKVLLNGDKREYTGKVVGIDPKTDLAVIKIDAKDLPTVPWGDSDKLEVGEYVLAIGNPFGLNQTVTLGIVSATGRANVGIADYEDFIQTDAAINPGNSGGALVNARGELVGINTAIFSRSGGYMGIGFAVPANMSRTVMNSLVQHGKVVRGWLGVSIQEVTPTLAKQFGLKEPKGALVSEVLEDTPAAKAGLKSGDIITAFDGKAIEGPSMLRNYVAQTPVGREVRVEALRERKTIRADVKIGEQPKDTGDEPEEVDEGAAQHGALTGIEVRPLTPEVLRQLGLPPGSAGVLVSGVAGGSPAEAAGLQPGDVITELNRRPVRNLADFRRLVGKLGKKQNVLLYVNRQGRKLFIAIKP